MNEVVLDAAAIYRLWRLIARDTILDGPRDRFIEDAWLRAKRNHEGPGQPPEPKSIMLLGCPWCLGWWLTIAALICRWRTPRVWSVMRAVCATSALVGLIATVEDRLHPA